MCIYMYIYIISMFACMHVCVFVFMFVCISVCECAVSVCCGHILFMCVYEKKYNAPQKVGTAESRGPTQPKKHRDMYDRTNRFRTTNLKHHWFRWMLWGARKWRCLSSLSSPKEAISCNGTRRMANSTASAQLQLQTTPSAFYSQMVTESSVNLNFEA